MQLYRPARIIQALSILFVALFILQGCQREIDSPAGGTGPGVNDAIRVTGGVNGIVVDENNQPVSGVTVTSGTASTTTDRYGAFRFSNISLSKANGTVKVTRPGYFTAYRSFISVEGRINNVRIKLIPKTPGGSFASSAGGTVTIAGGGKLVIPADAVTDASGGAYSGMVNVAMAWIDPSSADLPYILMGDLRGITTTGEERGLSTYGMMGVELTGGAGQPLKIASGKTAELTFPIPSSLQGSAPATIDLWYFDEATARWKQEGTATKSGTNYIANVTHFSFWNCDAPFPLIDLCMNLKDPSGNPLINVQVRIKRVVNNTYGYGRTDSLGNLCGKVPKDEALVLEVLDICNTVVFSQNIGPFSANTTLPPITVNIPPANSLIITGSVTNCASANVTTGAAIIYIAGGHHYTIPVTNGAFSFNLLRCNNTSVINFTVIGVDYSVSQQSAPVTGSAVAGTVNVGSLQACGTSSVQFVELLLDGVPTNFVSPPHNIMSIDSTAVPPFSNNTTIYASNQSGGNISSVYFTFYNNAIPGAYQLLSFGAGIYTIYGTNRTITITDFGPPVSGFIEGNFSIQVTHGGPPQNLVCTFRVRRN